MANFINKYLNQSAYDADNTKQYPNTSLVGTDIVFAMTAPTPTAFGGLTVKYNIVDASAEITLFNGGGASSSSSSSSSSSESGGGGALPTTMIVDGVSETPINTWRFETAGEHIVQYEFADNIVPAIFLSGNSIVTEAIIGDDITEIGNEAFNCNNLTTATIGTGITSIGDTAFYNYGNLVSITIEATTPPTLGNYSLSGDYPIYVPAESVNSYKTDSAWLDYASRIFAIQE